MPYCFSGDRKTLGSPPYAAATLPAQLQLGDTRKHKEGSAKSKHGWNLACTDKEGHLGATPRWKAGSCKTVSGLCILSLLRLMHRLLFHLPRYEIHSQPCTLSSGMTEGDKPSSETLDW